MPDSITRSRAPAANLLRWSLLILIAFLVGCFDKPSPQVVLQGETMGTTWQATVVDPQNLDEKALQAAIENRLSDINALMSTYDPESELSQFNALQSVEWQPMATETLEIIETAHRVSKATSGAYDVTLGSVSELWGFGQGNTPDTAPLLDDILLLLNDVGYQLLKISASRNKVRKLNENLQVDLSSLAKGYAVDQIGELIEAAGQTRYLAEIGGEIRTRGRAADEGMWKIGIEWPESAGTPEMTGIQVENAHIASSGDYRNYEVIDGQRYTHIIDGRSGYPISHGLASVTVLHGSTMRADAWATAFMVLGFEESLQIANEKGLAVRFVIREGDAFRVETTQVFDAYAIN
ncbi:MAG: FAD:protein FMN transferase [Gammaproteobacteria bacterium]|nr:FAD:protein FMN transferase [Gammaproteobacteria bacterium]